MLIAHGPIGYLLAYTSKLRWQAGLSKRTRTYVFIAAFLGGIFPDVDLFYFYFVDSTVSHRQFITHSFLPYIILILVSVVVWRSPKLRAWGIGLALFSVGACSHLCADMLIGQAAIFLPFSDAMLGLVSFQWYRDSWFMQYRLATNLVTEFIFIAIAIGTCIKRWKLWAAVSMVGVVVLAVSIVWLNQHSYQPNGYFYYSDQDSDGVLNAYDRDLDGDGILNIDDIDVDQDGSLNSHEVYLETFSANQSLFDYTFGNVLEIPRRLGLVNDVVLTQRLFSNTGIFFSEELAADYANNADGYSSNPADNRFGMNVENWKTWLTHTQRLWEPTYAFNEFDIVFFKSGHVAVYTYSQGYAAVLDVDASHPFAQYKSIAEVVQREGEVVAIGRVLPNESANETAPSALLE